MENGLPFYAMDFAFYNSMGIYSFEARCEMLKEIGYDATHLSVWHGERWRDVEKLKNVKGEIWAGRRRRVRCVRSFTRRGPSKKCRHFKDAGNYGRVQHG